MKIQNELLKYVHALNSSNFDLSHVEEHGFNNRYIDVACFTFGIKKDDILGKSRMQSLVWSRYILYNYVKTNSGLVYEKIGEIFKKDHSSIIHGVKMHKEFLEYNDFDYCQMNDEFNKQIQSDRFVQ